MNRRDAEAGRRDEPVRAPGFGVCAIYGIANRLKLTWCRISERLRFGVVPETDGSDRPVVVVLDGVGRFQFAPYMIRRVCREASLDYAVIRFDWQFGAVGEIWSDLMWLRRNRVQAVRFARLLRRLRREQPKRPIHVFAFSGGNGVAVFGCEYLHGLDVVDTLIMAQPALSPGYDLSRALGAARRGYVLISERDLLILGLGTRLFGTMDRVYRPSAGLQGFVRPSGLPAEARAAYDRCRVFRWRPTWVRADHNGGHTGSISETFLRRFLGPMLDGSVDEPYERIAEAERAGST